MIKNKVIEDFVLKSGAHENPDDGMCIMEAVAYFAGEKHSDHPACVSPIIGAFLRRWNDDLDNVGRQKLKPYIEKVIGTAGNPEADEVRGWMCVDWLVRVHTPAAWDAAGAAAGAAAWDAAGAAAEPTKLSLQESALELLDRLIAIYSSNG